MIRFGGCRSNLRKAFDKRPEMRPTTSGRHELLQLPVVSQQGHTVARIKRHLREAQRRIHRMVELVEPVDARSQKPARVQHQPHSLAALDLIRLGDQLPPPGRGAPRNVAEFVSGAILAQALELPSVPPLALESFFQLDLAATNQIDAHPLRLSQVRIDAHVLTETRACPSLRHTQWASVAQPNIAKLGVSALAGFDR